MGLLALPQARINSSQFLDTIIEKYFRFDFSLSHTMNVIGVHVFMWDLVIYDFKEFNFTYEPRESRNYQCVASLASKIVPLNCEFLSTTISVVHSPHSETWTDFVSASSTQCLI
jgi:hypothetical protein